MASRSASHRTCRLRPSSRYTRSSNKADKRRVDREVHGMTAAKLVTRSMAVVGLVAAGAIGTGVAVMLPQLGVKALIGLAAGVAVVVFMVVFGRPREVLLAAYIAALTYNRQYFLFDDL